MPYYSLGQWLPDREAFENPGVVEAKHVLPGPNGFVPMRKPKVGVTVSATITMTFTGAFVGWGVAQANNPVAYEFAGTTGDGVFNNARLFSRSPQGSGKWTDRSQSLTGMSAQWHFEQFGQLVVAFGGDPTAFATPPQKVTLTNAPSGNFTLLGGSPPNAALVKTVRSFLVTANTTIGGVIFPNGLRWCGVGDATAWTASGTTQADSQIINDHGTITALEGGEYGLVFFQDSIVRMSYIGSPLIFQFDKIAQDIGAFDECTTKVGDNVYFWGTAGFGVVIAGQAVRILSKNRIDNWARSNIRYQNQSTQMRTVSDRQERRVYAQYRSKTAVDASGNYYDQFVMYDIDRDEFTRASMTTGLMYSAIFFDQTSAPVVPSKTLYLAYFQPKDGNNTYIFDGDNMPGTIITREMAPGDDRRIHLHAVRVKSEGAAKPMIQVGQRTNDNQSISYGATVTANTRDGEYKVRVNNRLLTTKIMTSVSASWSNISGFFYVGSPGDQY